MRSHIGHSARLRTYCRISATTHVEQFTVHIQDVSVRTLLPVLVPQIPTQDR